MLLQRIKADMKDALKAKQDVRLQTLRGALAAFTNELVSKGRKPTEELSEAEMQAVLKRLAKQRKDSIEQFTRGNRPELAAKESQELTFLEAYLPQMASREEIVRIAEAKKAEFATDAGGKGKLMGVVMKELGGNADGSLVKEIVEALFS